jgi:hypothetical protein
MAMADVPQEDELQRAIFEHVARSDGFVPDVDVKGLREVPGEQRRYDAELFLSFVRFREGGDADALRDALTRVRDGCAAGDILGGRLTNVEVAEDAPGIFNEGRERVVLAAHLAFSV